MNTPAFAYYPRLGRVERYVLEHLADQITLADAARVAGLERTYFSAYFRRKTGVCFRDWLAGVRVERASELLRQRDYSIRRVAFETGFTSLRTFERVFARVARQPPREFKKRVRPA